MTTTIEIAGRLYPASWVIERRVLGETSVWDAQLPLETGMVVGITKWDDGEVMMDLLTPKEASREWGDHLDSVPSATFDGIESDVPNVLREWSCV